MVDSAPKGAVVGEVNVEMARAWDGSEGERWATHATGYERASSRQWRRFLELVPIREVDRILDVGCGSGRSTCDVARLAPAGSATGVDLSSAMLAVARARAAHEGLTNVRFERADAQVHTFDQAVVDLVVSVFGTMFFDDAVAAFRNFRRALAPDGRLAMLVWRGMGRNEWVFAVRDALAVGRQLPEPPRDAPGPFAFADRDRVREIVETAGFRNVQFQDVDEPADLGADVDEAYAFVSDLGITHGLLSDLDEPTACRALANLKAALSGHATSEGVLLGASSWLVTAAV
jgi:SAM-dependent methyltransferase